MKCIRCGKSEPEVTFREHKEILNKKCNECLGEIDAEMKGAEPAIVVTYHESEKLKGADLYLMIQQKIKSDTGMIHITAKAMAEIVTAKTGMIINYSTMLRVRDHARLSKLTAKIIATFLGIDSNRIKTITLFGGRVTTASNGRWQKNPVDDFFKKDKGAMSIRFFINPALLTGEEKCLKSAA